MQEETFPGRRVTVMGLGTFGGGLAAARYLLDRGAEVTVTDLRPQSELADSIALLPHRPTLHLRLGGHDEADFTSSDLIVASPAIRPGNRFLSLARQQGIPVTSEIRLFWQRCRGPIIGVTGSNGKSTTATLIHDLLAAAGRRVWLGGNIGRSLLSDLDDIRPADCVVLELSSFQLADLNSERLSPHVAVVTNFTPNHLDWHGSIEAYAEAKQTILRWQRSGDMAVRHRSEAVSQWPTAAQSVFCDTVKLQNGSVLLSLESIPDGRLPTDVDLVNTREQATTSDCDSTIRDAGAQKLRRSQCELRLDYSRYPALQSAHQQSNATLAAATGLTLGVSPETIDVALKSFAGIPHRFQFLGEYHRRRFINDSASTTPESTIAALQSSREPPVLIVGGAEKGSRLEPLADAIISRAAAAIVIGDVQTQLVVELEAHLSRPGMQNQPPALGVIRQCETLPAALDAAIECSSTGATILFSPGFSSGSQFRNFADRGEEFRELVQKRVKGSGAWR